MATLNPNIILSGRQPDVVNALAGGAQAAKAVNTVQRQNALADLYERQGPGIMAGDQNALNALARLSPDAALGVQDTRQVMNIRGQENTRADERLRLARAQAARLAQAQVAQMTAAQVQAERDALERGLAGATAINDPQQWDDHMRSVGLDNLVGQFDNREVAFASALGLKDALERAAGPGPQSGAGRFYADQAEGLIPPDAEYSSGVTVNTGNSGPQIGTIPQGYQVVQDPQTGAYRMDPIPGGPADQEQQNAADAEAAAAEQQQQYGSVVFEDIGRVRDMLTGGRDQPVTGVMGAIAGMVPATEAADARALVETIKANIGFDRLQAMREASPTGGALGNVTERELATLQAVMGNLEFSQSREQLLQNLARLEAVYSDILTKAARTGDGTFVPQQGEMPDIPAMTYDDIANFLEQNPNVDAATRRALAGRVRALMGGE